MVDQITVFLENDKGRLASLTRTMADANINMSALSIADTADYGLVRIICADSAAAREVLEKAGYSATTSKVAAIAVPDRPGGMAELLEAMDALDVNIEYGYCFSHQGENAVMALKVADSAAAAKAVWTLEGAGFKVLSQEDL